MEISRIVVIVAGGGEGVGAARHAAHEGDVLARDDLGGALVEVDVARGRAGRSTHGGGEGVGRCRGTANRRSRSGRSCRGGRWGAAGGDSRRVGRSR